MTLVSENIRFVRIFAEVPLGGRPAQTHQTTLEVIDHGYFWRFTWLCLRKLQRYGKQ